MAPTAATAAVAAPATTAAVAATAGPPTAATAETSAAATAAPPRPTTANPQRTPIGAEAKTALWALFDGAAWRVALPRPGADAALDAFLAARGLSYSQAARQWSLFRRAARRRSDADALGLGAHAHADSLHAHRRRAFGADATLVNRFKSISRDAAWVSAATRALGLPVAANLRAGAWYAPGAAHGCYFKSTDGHAGRWALSARRTNLDLAARAAAAGGALVVDATRRGRSYPDALAKTVPIWACCLNRAVGDADAPLVCAPTVDAAEAEAIEARLPAFVASLRAVDLSALQALKAAPLAPIFVARAAGASDAGVVAAAAAAVAAARAAGATPLALLSASDDAPGDGYAHLQGCADDEDQWARGLTAAAFWRHADELLASTDERDAARRVAAIAKREPGDTDSCSWVAENLAVGGRRAGRPPGCWAAFDAVVNVTLDEYEGMGGAGYLQVPVAEGKKDRRGLEAGLPGALRFAAAHLAAGRRVLVHCAQGRDRSVAVAVALLAACFDERGDLDAARATALAAAADDADLRALVALGAAGKRRLLAALHRVAAARPDASPSRHTLKKLHRFFMSGEEAPA